ncbi:MAG: hypothetical protein U1F71_01180 [Verrucomicrobiaceae bacterium]
MMDSARDCWLRRLLIVYAFGAFAGLGMFLGLGDDRGVFLVLAMMAVATFPLFHFAARWPLRNPKEKDRK